MRRKKGTGSVETTRDGKHRARLVTDVGRRSLGVYETLEEASAVLEAAISELADTHHGEGVTLAMWGERVLNQREAEGFRGVPEERNRWKAYVHGTALARVPIRSLDRRDVLGWLDGMRARKATLSARKGQPRRVTGRRLSRATLLAALNIVRTVLEDATQRNVVRENVARGIRLPAEGRTREPWTYLSPPEQERVVRAAGADWPMVAFAIGTGLRQGEQWALQLDDVHLGPRPHVTVRFGSPGKPPKNGRIRRVPLFGMALAAVQTQLDALKAWAVRAGKQKQSFRNQHGLLFPSRRDEHRKRGEPKAFETARAGAELGRHVRWHDLRHTCASSLVCGWWGRAWSLEEVCAMLGHSSIKVTERYAHLAGSLVEDAARAHEEMTRGIPAAPLALPAHSNAPRVRRRNHSQSHLSESNRRPTVYESVGTVNNPEDMCDE